MASNTNNDAMRIVENKINGGRLLPVFILLLCFCMPIKAQNVFLSGNICSTQPWKLVWNDEFNGTSLNTDKWFRYYPLYPDNTDQSLFARTHSDPDAGNIEGQVFKDENVVVSDGTLKLIVKKEPSSWFGFDAPHSSGMIYSGMVFKEGKFEMRAKYPSGKGFWPAFWLWGGNPADEIDIAEFNAKEPSEMHHIAHWKPCYEPLAVEPCYTRTLSHLFNYTTDFHIYSVEWTPVWIIWKVDGIEVKRLNHYITQSGQFVNNCNVAAAAYAVNEQIPDVYMHIIADLAVYASDGDGYFTGKPDANTIFPNQFEIDYIRVYQQDLHDGLTDICAASTIVGNTNICNANNYTYQLESVNVNPTWLVSSNLQIMSSTATSITVRRLAASGNAFIKAQFSNDQPCSALITKNISIGGASGVPNFSIIENLAPCIPSTHPYGRYATSNGTSVNWSVSSGTTCLNCTTGSTAIVRPNSVGGFTLTASKSYTTGCGTTGTTTVSQSFYAPSCSNGGLQRVAVSPNPTSGNVRFNLENIELSDINRIEVRDLMNQLVRTISPYSTNIDTDFTGLNNGIYYVVVQLNTGTIVTNSFTINK